MLRRPAPRALCHLLCSPTLAVVGSTGGVIHVHAETPWTPPQAWGGPGKALGTPPGARGGSGSF